MHRNVIDAVHLPHGAHEGAEDADGGVIPQDVAVVDGLLDRLVPRGGVADAEHHLGLGKCFHQLPGD